MKRLTALVSVVLPLIFLSTPVLSSQSLTFQPRIVGGENYRIEQAPSTVALINNDKISSGSNYYQAQFCGGTVVNVRWVITAAHCMFDPADGLTPATLTSVLMGSSSLIEPNSDPINITEIVIHPEYTSPLSGFDVALLRLESDAVSPIIAVDDMSVVDGTLAFIAGWGALNQSEPNQNQAFPRQMQGAFLRMVPASTCNSRYEEYNGAISPSMLCADRDVNRIDTCQGDSGGPLYRVSLNGGSVQALAGITSWGIGCGEDETPGVYTLVSSHVPWIRSVVGSVATSSEQTLPLDAEPVLPGLLPQNDDPSLSTLEELGTGPFGYGMPIILLVFWIIRRPGLTYIASNAEHSDQSKRS